MTEIMRHLISEDVSETDPFCRSMIPLAFRRRNSPFRCKWQMVFLFIYCVLTACFFFSGHFVLVVSYFVLSIFFCLGAVDLDAFAPASLMAAAFGLYFLLPLAFLPDRVQLTLLYIAGTLLVSVISYLSLPRLNFGISRWLGENAQLRSDVTRVAARLQILGCLCFFLSVRLAGYSNPLGVFSSPLKYRFFMMVQGMTYFRVVIGFLIFTPVIVVAVGRYLNIASRRALIATSLVGLIYGLATGARGPAVFLIAQILMVRHLLHKELTLKLVLFMACVFLPFVAIAGQYRMLEYANRSGALNEVLSTINTEDILELVANRIDASRMFNDLMIRFNSDDVIWGESYYSFPLQVIPRAFWPGKPRLPNPEMTRIVGKNDPYLDISFDFGIFGEALLNFGWIGVLAGGLIIIAVVGPMQCLYEYAKTQRNAFCIVASALLFFAPFELVVSGLDQTLISLCFGMVEIALLRYLFFPRDVLSQLGPA